MADIPERNTVGTDCDFEQMTGIAKIARRGTTTA